LLQSHPASVSTAGIRPQGVRRTSMLEPLDDDLAGKPIARRSRP